MSLLAGWLRGNYYQENKTACILLICHYSQCGTGLIWLGLAQGVSLTMRESTEQRPDEARRIYGTAERKDKANKVKKLRCQEVNSKSAERNEHNDKHNKQRAKGIELRLKIVSRKQQKLEARRTSIKKPAASKRKMPTSTVPRLCVKTPNMSTRSRFLNLFALSGSNRRTDSAFRHRQHPHPQPRPEQSVLMSVPTATSVPRLRR